MPGWDDPAERERLEQLEKALAQLGEASSEFERLVHAPDLLEALGKLRLRELRRILFALVLIEQQRRADRPGTEPAD